MGEKARPKTRRGPPAVVVSCEHASNRIPAELAGLGLSAAVLATHVAWDPGAAAAARACARRLRCPLHLGRTSRLVVDLNRSLHHPKLVPRAAWGVPVPGNFAVGASERVRRVARWHEPYRAAVRADVERAIARRGACVHVSLHSFTPVLAGRERRPDVGLLYDPSRRAERDLASRLAGRLRASGWRAALNQPYRGTADGLTTLWRKRVFPAERYVGLEIELNQRLLDDRARFRRVIRDLAEALAAELPATQARRA